MIFKARDAEFRFPRSPVIMGVLNVTPDSFSDGGRYVAPTMAVDHGLRLAEWGAEIIDVGGESTRPGATPVLEAEELDRVLTVIEALSRKTDAVISIDTMKVNVARAAIESGAKIVNNVAAGRSERAMVDLVEESGAGYVVMHMEGDPETMQADPRYGDVVGEVNEFFASQLRNLKSLGVSETQIVFDPGIGFGKTLEHNLELVANIDRFLNLERPLLLGVSRKSFIGKAAAVEISDRLPGSLAGALFGANLGANIIRVHDVAETLQALKINEALNMHRN